MAISNVGRDSPSVRARVARTPRMYEALRRAQQDINWMLNNQQFLNPSVFDYIDKALALVEGKET